MQSANGKAFSLTTATQAWGSVDRSAGKQEVLATWWFRAVSLLLLLTSFWIVAAAGFAGSVGKWGLRDGHERYGIQQMLEGTAHRPFVYRQLVPVIAKYADKVVPLNIKEKLMKGNHPDRVFVKAVAVKDPAFRFRYLMVYYLSFLALYGSLFVLRRIVLDAGASRLAAVVAPAGFALAFPYIQTVGGYFYDTVELLFLGLTFLAASRARIALLLLMVLPATLNKETFLFFLPALYPVLRQHYGIAKALGLTGAGMLCSGIVNIGTKLMFAAAPGAPAEIHLFSNLAAYFQAWRYRQFEMTYGIIGPANIALLTILIVFAICLRGWPYCAPAVRRHIGIAACFNIPLFVAFAAPGELRNLSLLFIGLIILMAHAVDAEKRGLLKTDSHPAFKKQAE